MVVPPEESKVRFPENVSIVPSAALPILMFPIYASPNGKVLDPT